MHALDNRSTGGRFAPRRCRAQTQGDRKAAIYGCQCLPASHGRERTFHAGLVRRLRRCIHERCSCDVASWMGRPGLQRRGLPVFSRSSGSDAELSNRPLLLLLVDLKGAGADDPVDGASASQLFSGLSVMPPRDGFRWLVSRGSCSGRGPDAARRRRPRTDCRSRDSDACRRLSSSPAGHA